MSPTSPLASIRSTWPTPVASLWSEDRVPSWEAEHAESILTSTIATLRILRGWMLAELSALAPMAHVQSGYAGFDTDDTVREVARETAELLDAMRQLSGTLESSVFRSTNALGSYFLLDTRIQSFQDAMRAWSRATDDPYSRPGDRVLQAAADVLNRLDPIFEPLEALQELGRETSDEGLRVRWYLLDGAPAAGPFTELFPGVGSEALPSGPGLRLRCRLKPGVLLALDPPFPPITGPSEAPDYARAMAAWTLPESSFGEAPATGIRVVRFTRVQSEVPSGAGSRSASPAAAAPIALPGGTFQPPPPETRSDAPRAALVRTMQARADGNPGASDPGSAAPPYRPHAAPRPNAPLEPRGQHAPEVGPPAKAPAAAWFVVGMTILLLIGGVAAGAIAILAEQSGSSDYTPAFEEPVTSTASSGPALPSGVIDDKPAVPGAESSARERRDERRAQREARAANETPEPQTPPVDPDALRIQGSSDACPSAYRLSDGRILDRYRPPSTRAQADRLVADHQCGALRGPWAYPSTGEASELVATSAEVANAGAVWVGESSGARAAHSLMPIQDAKPPSEQEPTGEVWLVTRP